MTKVPDYLMNLVPVLPDLPTPQGDMSLLQKVLVPACLEQEFSPKKYISIPGGIMDLLKNKLLRPRPFFRAINFEKALDVSSVELWCKAEFFGAPTGSHKQNTAMAQAWYAKQAGFDTLVTETGAGQWGTAVANAGAILGMKVVIFWVRAPHDSKPHRRKFMELYGAKVFASPSLQTSHGRSLLTQNINHPGSLGIAVTEGLEYAKSHPGSCYVLGSVMNYVLLHQTIIGIETLRQVQEAGIWPDFVVSCFGGGSNFGGLAIPFLSLSLTQQPKPATRFIAAQNESAPNLSGKYEYDYPDHGKLAPKVKMFTLGSEWEGQPIAADGLRYHGSSPLMAHLKDKYGLIEPMNFAADEREIFEAGRLFLTTEGHLTAPESCHSIAAARRLALEAREQGVRRVIVFGVSGDGRLDIDAYSKHCLGI